MTWRRAARAGLLLLLTAAPVLAEEAAGSTHPVLRFVVSWLPFVVILLGGYLILRRAGGGKIGRHVDRSFEHMDRVERQNEEILDALRRIEDQLGK